MVIRNPLVMALIAAVVMCAGILGAPAAHSDYFQYPCPYPFVGTEADVQIIAHGGGQYCDGPTEINGTHFHCMAGGGGIGGGAIGLAPIGGLNVGGFGGSGIGLNMGDCHFVCPDEWRPPESFPNPPAAWIKPLTVDNKNNVCYPDHMAPNGPDSAAVPPADLGPPADHPRPGPPPAPAPVDTGDEGSPLTPGSPLPMP